MQLRATKYRKLGGEGAAWYASRNEAVGLGRVAPSSSCFPSSFVFIPEWRCTACAPDKTAHSTGFWLRQTSANPRGWGCVYNPGMRRPPHERSSQHNMGSSAPRERGGRVALARAMSKLG